MPITWRNVDGGATMRDALWGMAQAQTSLNSGLSAFDNIIKQRQAIDEQNWNAQKEDNTTDYLMAVNDPQTAKDFQDKRASLVDLLRSKGAQIDKRTALAALDNRGATLQARDVADINYRNTMTDAEQAASKDAAKQAILRGDTLTYNILRSANPDWRNGAELENFARTTGRQDTTWGREDAIEADRRLKAPLDRQLLEAQIKDENAGSELKGEQAHKAREEALAMARGEWPGHGGKGSGSSDKTAAKADADALKHSLFANGWTGDPDSNKSFEEVLKNKKDWTPHQKEDVRDAAGKIFREGGVPFLDDKGRPIRDNNGRPIMIPTPASVFQSNVNDDAEGVWGPLTGKWSTAGDNAYKRTTEYMNSPEARQQIIEALVAMPHPEKVPGAQRFLAALQARQKAGVGTPEAPTAQAAAQAAQYEDPLQATRALRAAQAMPSSVFFPGGNNTFKTAAQRAAELEAQKKTR